MTLILIMMINISKTQEQYWEKTKQFMITYNKAEGVQANDEASKKFGEYLDSLTAEDLIFAGRQCSKEFNNEFRKKGFSEGTGFLIGFFIQQYPKTAGVNDLRPIFKDIEDVNQSNMWRSTLIHALRDNWLKKIPDNQLREAINTIDKILSNKNAYYRITNEAIYTSRDLIREIENRSKSQKSSDNMNDANNMDNKSEEITDFYTRFSNRLINIANEPNLEPELQRITFSVLRDTLDKPIRSKKEFENITADLVRNYQKYELNSWKFLLQIADEKLHLQDCIDMAQEMTTNLTSKIEDEKDRDKKALLKFELDYFNRYLRGKNIR